MAHISQDCQLRLCDMSDILNQNNLDFFQNFPQFLVIHAVKVFGIVDKAEIDVFLELSFSYHDPVDVGNLISGSSAFSKPA